MSGVTGSIGDAVAGDAGRQHEAVYAIGVVGSHTHRDLATERVADHRGVVDAELAHEASNEAGLLGDGVVALLNASRVAEAFEIDGDDAMILGELGDQVMEAVCVAEKAVDEDRCAWAGPALDVVHRDAVDVDDLAGRFCGRASRYPRAGGSASGRRRRPQWRRRRPL